MMITTGRFLTARIPKLTEILSYIKEWNGSGIANKRVLSRSTDICSDLTPHFSTINQSVISASTIPKSSLVRKTKAETKIHSFWTSAFPNLIGENGIIKVDKMMVHLKKSQKLVQEFKNLNSKLEKISKNLESVVETGPTTGTMSKILMKKQLDYLAYLNPINVVILSSTGMLGHLIKIHENLTKLFKDSKAEDDFD